jgi:hypothetical protein
VLVVDAATARELMVKALPRVLLSTAARLYLLLFLRMDTSTALLLPAYVPDVGGLVTVTVTPLTPFWKPLRCAS